MWEWFSDAVKNTKWHIFESDSYDKMFPNNSEFFLCAQVESNFFLQLEITLKNSKESIKKVTKKKNENAVPLDLMADLVAFLFFYQ